MCVCLCVCLSRGRRLWLEGLELLELWLPAERCMDSFLFSSVVLPWPHCPPFSSHLLYLSYTTLLRDQHVVFSHDYFHWLIFPFCVLGRSSDRRDQAGDLAALQMVVSNALTEIECLFLFYWFHCQADTWKHSHRVFSLKKKNRFPKFLQNMTLHQRVCQYIPAFPHYHDNSSEVHAMWELLYKFSADVDVPQIFLQRSDIWLHTMQMFQGKQMMM